MLDVTQVEHLSDVTIWPQTLHSARDKHSSLLGPFVSYKKVLEHWSQEHLKRFLAFFSNRLIYFLPFISFFPRLRCFNWCQDFGSRDSCKNAIVPERSTLAYCKLQKSNVVNTCPAYYDMCAMNV
jgi:hypothetical protein